MPNEVVIDGNSLRLEDVVAVARDYATVVVSPAAHERAAAARRTVDRLVAEGTVV
jgi:histidine ammonia-lyase